MTPSPAALSRWCDDTITFLLELARGPLHGAAVELAAALAATLSTLEATDWRIVLARLERWEATFQMPPSYPQPARQLRLLLEAHSC